MKTVPLLHILESYFGIRKKIQKEVALVFGGDEEGEEGSSGSVSHVIAQENDVVCDDGGGLTSDLVLVHVFAVVQLPLY